ncbi:hypothetical protein MNBD_GAMMA21-2410 [hydrothermal vent metagenome]|uniref:Ribosome association toxin RatA n=1 Tax=hydrothermal vent metagenome TaxID=652676 RepID=A0A3B1A2E5_9ZZZZ
MPGNWHALILLLLSPMLHAGELLNSFVDEVDNHYILNLDMRIDGDYDSVYEVLIDFNHLDKVNQTITSSQLLESNDKIHKVQFMSNGCVWIICQDVNQVVIVTELGNGFIMSETLPDLSDISYGRTLWQVIDEGDSTRIKYHSDLVPDFWLPPFIGSSILQDRMLEEGIKTINGIERIINEEFE